MQKPTDLGDSVMLRTKITLPVQHDKLVLRNHLANLLDKGRRTRLTTICAPAGFGKTTLLSQWADNASFPIIWISLDDKDNDLMRFWRYLIYGLTSTCMPGLSAAIGPLMQSYPQTSIYTIVDALINELYEYNKEMAIILDDYHTINHVPIHDSLAYLVDYLPRHVHLTITSRSSLPFTVAKWHVRGGVTEITSQSLLFTEKEAAMFYREIAHLSLSTEQLGKLSAFTEGWVAGMQLVALSLQNQLDCDRFIEELSGSPQNVADFLLEEVLFRLPSDMQEFLLHTSILQRMDAAICDAIRQRNDSDAMLARLQKQHLFLIPLDHAGRWFRYHHLFSDFLRAELQKKEPQNWLHLHQLASRAFADMGLLDEAIDHAIRAKQYEQAAQLIEAHIVAVLARGEFATLIRWFDSFPAPAEMLSPLLSLLFAFILVVAGETVRAAAEIDRLEAACRSWPPSEEQRQFLGGVFFVRANLVFATGDFPRWFAQAEQFYERLPESPVFYQFNYNTTEPFIRRTAFGLKGILNEHTEAIGLRFSEILESHGWRDSLMNMYVNQALAEGYYEWNRLADSRALLDKVQRIAWDKQVAGLYIPNCLTRARHHWANGERQLARYVIDEAIQTVQKWGEPHWQRPLLAFHTRLDLLMGDVERAWSRAEPLRQSIGMQATLAKELELLTLVRLYMAKNEYEQARELLTALKPLAKRENCLVSQCEITLLQSLLEYQDDNQTDAIGFLHEALLLAESNGYIRSFVDEGEPMHQLLVAYRKTQAWNTVSRDYVNMLTQLGESGTKELPFPLSPLTQKELALLDLIGQGATNKVMAEQLSLSVGTVKIYLNRIYGKLGVSSRTQALLKAQELSLLK